MIRIGVKLPMTPACLRPNSRAHWRKRATQTHKLRLISQNFFAKKVRQLRSAGITVPVSSINIKRKYFFKTDRRRDKDNLNASCKSINDGMVDSGLIVDDNGDNIVWQDSTIRVDKSIAHEFIYYDITVLYKEGLIPSINLYDLL